MADSVRQSGAPHHACQCGQIRIPETLMGCYIELRALSLDLIESSDHWDTIILRS